MRLGPVRFQTNRGQAVREGHLRVVLFGGDVAQVIVRFSKAWLQLDGRGVMLRGLWQPTDLLQDLRQTIMGVRVIRLGAQRREITFSSFFGSAFVREISPQVALGFDQVGRGADGGGELFPPLAHLALASQDIAEVVARLSAVGLELQRGDEALFGLVEFALVEEDYSQVVIRLRVGAQVQNSGKLFDGRLVPARSEEHTSELS